MYFDVILPSIVSIITVIIVMLYAKFEVKVKSLVEEREFKIRDAVLLVVAMGIMVSIIVFVPQQAIQILFLVAYSFILFLFTFVAFEKWYFALLPPIVFVTLYFSSFWGVELRNLFAIIFVISISIYVGGLFSWKTVMVFAALITVMDFIQVFLTGFMGTSADKLVELELPILIEVRTFPLPGIIRLGLGDIFLSGLLTIQTAIRYGRKAGIISAIMIGFAFFIFETSYYYASVYYGFTGYFPATLVVVGGWILGLTIFKLLRAHA